MRWDMHYLETSEAGTAGEGDVTDVGLRVGWHGLVDDEGAVPKIRASGLLHLPELLERLNHIHWKRIDYITVPHNYLVATDEDMFARPKQSIASATGLRPFEASF